LLGFIEKEYDNKTYYNHIRNNNTNIMHRYNKIDQDQTISGENHDKDNVSDNKYIL